MDKLVICCMMSELAIKRKKKNIRAVVEKGERIRPNTVVARQREAGMLNLRGFTNTHALIRFVKRHMQEEIRIFADDISKKNKKKHIWFEIL